ncbi:unnamed protein product, partial [Prorocentrum cordatum]
MFVYFEVLFHEVQQGVGFESKPGAAAAKAALRERGAQGVASRLGKMSKLRNAAGHPDVRLLHDIRRVFVEPAFDDNVQMKSKQVAEKVNQTEALMQSKVGSDQLSVKSFDPKLEGKSVEPQAMDMKSNTSQCKGIDGGKFQHDEAAINDILRKDISELKAELAAETGLEFELVATRVALASVTIGSGQLAQQVVELAPGKSEAEQEQMDPRVALADAKQRLEEVRHNAAEACQSALALAREAVAVAAPRECRRRDWRGRRCAAWVQGSGRQCAGLVAACVV